MANKSKYAGMGKDTLTAEIKTRRAAGRKISVDLRGDEDTLRAALDTDDVENGEFPPASATSKDPTLAGSGTLAPKPEANAPPVPPANKPKLPPVSVREVGAAGDSHGKPPGLHNQLARQAEAPASQPTQPDEVEWAGGDLYKHKGDNLTYQVVKREADAFSKPVKARVPSQESGHPGLYWEGTAAEFEAVFTKV